MQYYQKNAARIKYSNNQDAGLFDKENILLELHENDNTLHKLKEIKEFEWFRYKTMGGLIYQGVGMIRAKANIAMTNLVYSAD